MEALRMWWWAVSELWSWAMVVVIPVAAYRWLDRWLARWLARGNRRR